MLVGDRELVDRARYLAQQARQPVLHYEHTEIGYNYRLSNLLAAVGRAQLERLPTMIKRRHEIHHAYVDALGGLEGLGFMPWDDRGTPNGWLTVMTLSADCGTRPGEVCAALAAQEIEARPAWKPMHLQPVFAEACGWRGGRRVLFDAGVCLPSGSGLTDAELERVSAAVRKEFP